jgi:hypothetical protein
MIEGSGSVSLTNGSGWPKNILILHIRIRIRNTAYLYVLHYRMVAMQTHEKNSAEKRDEYYLNEIKKLYENLTVRGEGVE